jgi:hypothetical protein
VSTISYIRYYLLLFIAYIKYLLANAFIRYEDYPFETRVAVIITFVCSFLIIMMQCTLIISGFRRKKKERLENSIVFRFGKGMAWILSDDADHPVSNEEILEAFGVDRAHMGKELLKSDQEKKMFSDVFYMDYITEKSESSLLENIHNMLRLFGISDYLEKQVSVGKMKSIADSLHKMRAFKLPVSPWVVNKLLNSRNLHVQRLAMYTTIMSSSDSSLEYFETDFFDKHCCIRDEIELAYSLQRRRREGLKLPNLARWANIQMNEKTQCMFVRLMRRFNEVEYCGELRELFKDSKKKKLIEEISRTWGYLHYVECEDLLIDSLMTMPDDIKVAMMHAMTRLGTGRSMDAMLEGFRTTTNPHVRYEAIRCIYNYGKEGREMFNKLEKEASDADKKYFAFFHNPITLEKIRLDKEQAYHPSVETVFNG